MGPPPEPFIILTVIMLVLFALIIAFLGAGVLIVARWITSTV